ncbi:Fatty acid amide hydrolase-like [Oopsacas minuta]|uniref:Fatty acid amide hydrolase-like n=1 Tax=Oopsacas minuta TaxID=111878 RepID=A0AAV7K1K7_9METZ|nr:Fatty acid amide hydrolase-like [Oopsacas minuta]
MILLLSGFVVGAISAAFVFPLLCSVVKALLGIGPSGKVQVAPPIQEVIDAGGGEYRSEEHFAPKLTGKLFLWFSNFMWTPFGKEWVLSKLMRDNHLFDARERYLPEAATFYPTPPFIPFPEQSVREDGKSEKDEIDTLIGCVPSRSKDSSAETDEFVFPSILDYLHAYRCGRVTPVIVAERIIESIRASDSLSPPLRAFVQWNETEIRKQAEESTRRYRDKDNIRPLEGIPVGVKESIPTKPYILRVGSSFLPIGAQAISNWEEAEVVLRLRQAGAIIIGVTNLHEFGVGPSGSNVNKLHQTARNPYDMSRYPGGSSSGSGAAVASGLIPLALGTDGGGSIRIPSSISGLVGLKATFGRVTEGKMISSAPTITNIGPLCTSVVDTALSYLLLAGPGPNDPNGLQQGPVTIGNFLTAKDNAKGMKVGIYRAWFNHCEPDVSKVCQEALKWITDAGAELVDIHIPEMNATYISLVSIFLSELTSAYKYDFYDHFKDINSDTKQNLAIGDAISSADYTVASRQRTRAIQVLKSVFSKVDILVTPTTACTAHIMSPSHLSHGCANIKTTTKLSRFTVIGNLTGAPAIAIPVGYDSNNLPVSLQLMTRWWREDLLFMLASQIEKRVAKRKPKIFYDILQL